MTAARIETIGEAQLYLADCADVLPTLPRPGAVITDPPYEAEAHSDKRRINTPEGIRANVLPFPAITATQRTHLAQFCGSRCDGWALIFCQVEAVTLWRDALQRHGARYKRAMVWCKPDGPPQFNGEGPAQGYESIVAAWCARTRARWNGGGKRGVFVVPQRPGRHGGHPTEKPLALMSQLVALFSDPGDLIIDPFMGSGSTGVAALSLGRRFIGIEKDPTFFDLAVARLTAQHNQPRLFGEPPRPRPRYPGPAALAVR